MTAHHKATAEGAPPRSEGAGKGRREVDDAFVHPYIPNSVPAVKRQMLADAGVEDIEQILAQIPSELRIQGLMDLPEPLTSEYDLRRHVEELLARNTATDEYLSFLGGGCARHYVPALCDEIVSRGEFLTAYSGGNYSDLGKHQARFEYNSLMAELLDYEVCVEPLYDWGGSAGFALRMASRITGRRAALVPANMGRERLSLVRELCEPAFMPGHIELREVACLPDGTLDLADLDAKLGDDVAAVYFENPGYLGRLEPRAAEICDLARAAGAVSVAGVDPISLGIVTPPGSYGADIAVGDLQPLGIHMSAGTGLAGFMAFRDEEVFLRECPTAIYTILDTRVPGEHTFGELLSDRTSYGVRDKAPDYVGTQTGLWAVCAGVYLAVMGPQGMREVGETILRRAHYAAARLGALPGVDLPLGDGFFKEFPLRFDGTGRTVAEVNAALLERGIFGGRDLSADYPELGQSALYCVTEMHTRADIDRLVSMLGEVLP
jgi:glycine dehydrogenase subunit 1